MRSCSIVQLCVSYLKRTVPELKVARYNAPMFETLLSALGLNRKGYVCWCLFGQEILHRGLQWFSGYTASKPLCPRKRAEIRHLLAKTGRNHPACACLSILYLDDMVAHGGTLPYNPPIKVSEGLDEKSLYGEMSTTGVDLWSPSQTFRSWK